MDCNRQQPTDRPSRKRKATDEHIQQFLEGDDESEFSDVDDEVTDRNFVIEEEMHEDSEVSGGEDQERLEEQLISPGSLDSRLVYLSNSRIVRM